MVWVALGVVVAVVVIAVAIAKGRRGIVEGPGGEPTLETAVDVVIDVRDARPASVDDVIPSYDNLRAVDIVDALRYLSPDALSVVREHEAEHKGRKTILSKIDALQRA